jgi:DNA-binding transcriptional LysR family regulator
LVRAATPEFKGVLTPVLTDFHIQEATLYLVYVSRKYLPLKIRAFIDLVAQPTTRAPVLTVVEGR